MSLVDEQGALSAGWSGGELFRYVYLPGESQLEAPRPYFHPVRTLCGATVTAYRPEDHVWHKGISWALPTMDDENFWGGPTYVRDQGYVQLDNNGTQRHIGFDRLDSTDDRIDVAENLEWVTQGGALMFTERRSFSVRVHPDLGAWQLAYRSEMTNTSGAKVSLGSPTTRGRDAAGYGGLFWRAPNSFIGGAVLSPEGPGGDELMGSRGPWLGFAGAGATVVFRDHGTNYNHPTRWFVRAGEFAGICPAPFYDTEHEVAAGEKLSLRYDVLIADGIGDVDACTRLADRATDTDLLT